MSRLTLAIAAVPRRLLLLLLLSGLWLSAFHGSAVAQTAATADTEAVEAFLRERADAERAAGPGFSGKDSEGRSVFGAQLFQGEFRNLSFTGFNPDYRVGVGDQIQLMIWGAVEEALELPVDPQGNIFVPRVGPIRVSGVRNGDLNGVIAGRVKEVFTQSVEIYANLLSTQTVKVFVAGFVKRPGLYEGYASDSLLFFLDRAGGIDLDRGSFRKVALRRNGEERAAVDLYRFFRDGDLPRVQLRDGDVVFVPPVGDTITIRGAVTSPGRFEFDSGGRRLGPLLELAQPAASATHANIRRVVDGQGFALNLPLEKARDQEMNPGDVVDLTSAERPETLLIGITGEHRGEEFIVLPYGATLSDALASIEPGKRSNLEAVQLFRESVARRQRELLEQSLANLERTAMNARSDSLEEAQLRNEEAELIQRFVDRARRITPRGQVLLGNRAEAATLFLEEGDVLYVPPRNRIISIAGAVRFPNSQIYAEGSTVSDYLDNAGGLAPGADRDNILLIKANGGIVTVRRPNREPVDPGDEIFVLPKPDGKFIQLAKDVTTILYQIAIAARVVVDL